jgi:hypothetical protein
MKRSMALVAVALPLCLAAQAANAQGIGLKGGVIFNNVSNRGALPGSLDRRTGFTGGLTASTLKGPLGFGVEALFAQRGLNASSPGDERRLDYIDVPAYLRVMIPTSGVAPYLYAGPQISFELRCRAGGADCSSGRPTTSYAGIIGAGLFFGDHDGLSVEGRYMYGLTDLKLNTVTTSESYKTRSFMILAGLHFR